jgi:hypothetical protein
MKTLDDGTPVVWEPLPGGQTLALSCPADMILCDGTRGGGKTDSQLMAFRSLVGMGYGSFWRGIIFDREYKDLDDIVAKSLRWFTQLNDGAKFINSQTAYKWYWPTGEELYFRAIQRQEDYWKYHGQEFAFIGWNELTKFPTERLFEDMMSCNRTSFVSKEHPIYIDPEIYDREGRIVQVPAEFGVPYYLPPIPLKVFATTNAFGPGHNWVKDKFVVKAPAGRIVRNVINVFNPQSQKREDVVRTQVRIFSSYRDNKFLDPKYVANLEQISDPNKRKAWLLGSWDIVSGGMFDDVWDPPTHVVKAFKIPATWAISRSYDHGTARPFSVGWWAISDGTPYTDAFGKKQRTIKGDLFRIAEWYGSSGRANQGLNLMPDDLTRGILEREVRMGIERKVQKGPSDTNIWDVQTGDSWAAQMAKPIKVNGIMMAGVQWVKAKKEKGSRIAGWRKLRYYLINAKTETRKSGDNCVTIPREFPGLFVFDNCESFLKFFPTLPRDDVNPDDVDTEAEDHIGDEVRYFVSSQKRKFSNRTEGL